jgi:hypothetical protein
MKGYRLILFFAFLLLTRQILGQISPPGLGAAKTVSWFAFGVKQELDTLKKWQSMSYIGLGRKSNPNNYNPLFKSSILVLNQEFYHQFHKHWQYSIALSYRRQDQYDDNPPYEHEIPNIEQEFRLYSRFSYILKTSRIKFVPTFREEFRKFYSPNFRNVPEDFQLRSRLRLQLTVTLNAKKTQRLIVSSEQLFSVSKETTPNTWTDFNYRESRFSLYYSLAPQSIPFIFSIGYMNNIVGYKSPLSVNYLAFDIIFVNPFKSKQRSTKATHNNLE